MGAQQEARPVFSALGSIISSAGRLEVGTVGRTDFIYFHFITDVAKNPVVVYNPLEFSSLLAILDDIPNLLVACQPGQVIKLGSLRGKPTVLSLAVVNPLEGAPFLLLKFQLGRTHVDAPIPLAETLTLLHDERLSSGEVQTLTGTLQSDPATKTWHLGGRLVSIASVVCAGIGSFGEYVHPDEVRPDETINGALLVDSGEEQLFAFQTEELWKPTSTIDLPLAQEGDKALVAGQTYRCRLLHDEFIDQLTEPIAEQWLAKLALSRLICDLLDHEEEAAYELWSGQSANPILQRGISALERGLVSPHDRNLYQLTSAYLHSLGADPNESGQSVNSILEALFAKVSTEQPGLKRLLLDNWALLLKDIFGASPPPQALESWKAARKGYQGKLVPKTFSFFPPDGWPTTTEAQPQIETPLIDHKPAQDTSLSNELDLTPNSDEDPTSQSAQASPKQKPIKKGLALIGLALFVALGIGITLKPSNVSNTVATSATSPSASPTPTPQADTGLTPTPLVDATTSPLAAVPTTSSPSLPSPNASAFNLSSLTAAQLSHPSLGGLNPEEKYFIDREIPGLTMIGHGEGWSRYLKDDSELILGAQQSSSLKSTRARSFAGTALYNNNTKLFDAKGATGSLSTEVETALKAADIVPIYDKAHEKLLGFHQGETFSSSTPALGQPPAEAILTALDDRSVAQFQQAVTPESANLRFMNGSSLIESVIDRPGAPEYLKVLLEKGATIEGGVGSKALWLTKDPRVAALLLKAGAPPDEPGPDGVTKLFGAPPRMTQELLAAKANPNFVGPNGQTPLFGTQDPETIKLLLKAGTNPNTTDVDGKTALMGAPLELAKILLKGGADPSLKDKAGKTALDYAQGNHELIKLLTSLASKTATPKPSPSPR